jgi:ubiquinone/menaquinone biosynthesis C-methylase UbiE
MGVYDDWVLPRVMNLAMGAKVVAEQRAKALAGVKGRVLEVGFGSGHNLPHYPAGVERVVGIDPSGESAKLARARIAEAPFPVEFLPLSGEQLPAPDGSFDSVVSTFTLCTIPDALAALRQMRRVLAPGGRFFFLEHGRSDDAKVRRWQDRLNGAQRWLVGGCNLNRPMDQLVVEAGFELESLERYYAQGPRFLSCLYRGVARDSRISRPA